MKWCVTLSGDGWSSFIHPFREESDNPLTDVYPTFQEAKRECLNELKYHLAEVKKIIAHTKKQRAKSGGWALEK